MSSRLASRSRRVKAPTTSSGVAPDRARALVASGYTLVKASIDGPVGFLAVPAQVARFTADLEALREAVGPEADFGIDLHGRVSVPHARRARDRLRLRDQRAA